ncbi:MAG: tRNA uridine-5-carboxymethylaminomethyl(34) synthesis GTPase MnmE, partial [Ignavibacteria bacterium]|nr:tRNA uridine-5-carboxymethylaminomethyl(34) synthesis GTPase MnmE [Ignavibacteria bacterium]
MHFNFQSKDTICALSTAAGMAAIAVVRISGSTSFDVVSKYFKAKSKKFSFETARSHGVYFGEFFDQDELVDEVLVSVFKAPHSYTGENMVEISCHGSTYIQQRILMLLLDNG